jgi:hypothetical protein
MKMILRTCIGIARQYPFSYSKSWSTGMCSSGGTVPWRTSSFWGSMFPIYCRSHWNTYETSYSWRPFQFPVSVSRLPPYPTPTPRIRIDTPAFSGIMEQGGGIA